MSFRRDPHAVKGGTSSRISTGGYDNSHHDPHAVKSSVPLGKTSPARLSVSRSEQKHRSFAAPLEHNSTPSDQRFQRSISSVTGGSSPSSEVTLRRSVSLTGSGGEIVAPLDSLRGLTDDDIHESAYELVLAVAGAKATVQATPREDKNKTNKLGLRKAFGFGKKPPSSDPSNGTGGSTTIVEIFRRQMQMSEAATTRIQKALSKSGASQVGTRNTSSVLPVELLQWTSIMDFPNTKDYTRFQRRQLSLLEEGLITHPALPAGADNMASAMRLKQAIAQLRSSEGQDLSSRRNTETMQLLRKSAYGIAEGVGPAGELETMHWADGFPLNAHLYLALLRSLFHTLEEGNLVDEMDELMELIRTTWSVLAINETFHSVCFAWTLIRQHVVTGKKESGLLSAAERALRAVSDGSEPREDDEEMETGKKARLGPQQINFLRGMLASIQTWADKQLFTYHECFADGANSLMENLLGISLEAEATMQAEEMQGAGRRASQDPVKKCEEYIRSSVKSAFATRMAESDGKRHSQSGSPQPLMVVLADETLALAKAEEKGYSPVFRRFHPSPGAVACATLHSCFRRELKGFLAEISVLTPEAAQALSSASSMEKELINMAVMDSVEAEDGGRAIIREMAPYDADNLAGQLARQWVMERLERLKIFGDRALQSEAWDPNANRDHFGTSVVDVMRVVDETLDAFFDLDLPSNPNLVKELVAGLDRFFQRYSQKICAQCGAKDRLIPALPPLTRYKKDVLAKIVKERKKADGSTHGRASVTKNDSTPAPGEGLDLTRLCVRINTVHRLGHEIELAEKKICTVAVQKGHAAAALTPVKEVAPVRKSLLSWNGAMSASMLKQTPKATSATGEPLPRADDLTKALQETCDVMKDTIQQLCSYTACKVVYYDLRSPFLDNLYSCSVSGARMPVVMQHLEPQLMTIADTLDTRIRNDLVKALMEASLDAVLRVLLAGGPSRAFTLKDADLLDDDLEALKDMFVADGHGLPGAQAESLASPVTQVLNLFHFDTATLIQNFQASSSEGVGGGKGKITRSPAPPLATKGYLGFLKSARATDADTVLRVLCYRADHNASKFLKTKFDLPKSTK